MTGREQIAIVKHVPMSVLKKRIKHPKGLPEVVPRLLFIRLRYNEVSVVKAAEAVGVSPQTGYNWQERWNAEGLAGLVPKYAGGRPSRLTTDQKTALLEKLRENEHWTTTEVQHLIQSDFDVKYSLNQVRRILRSFGMHFGKPYPRDYRRPADAERQLKKNLPRMSKHTVLAFFDECSPQTTANTQRMWSFRRTPLVKNTEKIRANTFGIFAVNGNSIVTFRERSKQEDIREVLKEFRRANPNKRLVIVLDNFSSHHAMLVREYAAENGIRFAYLPPYSPDLNPIEQVWRTIKREVAATFIAGREHLMATITEAFKKLVAKRSYWEKWVVKFLSSKYASKLLREWL